MEGREDDVLARATVEANQIFGRLGNAVEDSLREGGERPLDVLEISRKAGLEIDEGVLERLEIPRIVHPLLFCPWHQWWPWRPLWCWWWHRYYPWFECCPWYWHRCRPWGIG